MNISKILSLLDFTILDAAAVLEPRRFYLLSPNAATFEVDLPASPETGDGIAFASTSDVATYNVTIDGNGNTIDGDATLVVDVAIASFYLIFDGSEWRVS